MTYRSKCLFKGLVNIIKDLFHFYLGGRSPEESVELSEAEVTGGFESTDVGAGSQAWISVKAGSSPTSSVISSPA